MTDYTIKKSVPKSGVTQSRVPEAKQKLFRIQDEESDSGIDSYDEEDISPCSKIIRLIPM